MLLKRLELSGFKSFARPTTLDFTTPVTAIVGPNGSGKSNISEAIRFVLGEQSMKSLRSKQSEDLIFNGTKDAARLNRASVAITFDNRSRILPIDYDDVEVKRDIYRDGQFLYYINGEKVRLKDIVELLSAVNIGISSHHIISQGEADRILAASPKERRIMIEDALGLRAYYHKKNESTRKLAKTRENVAKVESLRRELAPHLRFLEKQVQKIQEARELKADLVVRCREYFKIADALIRHEREHLARERSAPVLALAGIEGEIAEKGRTLAEMEAREHKSDRVAALEVALKEAQDRKDDLSRTLGRLEGMYEYEERRIREEEARREEARQAADRPVSVPLSALRSFIGSLRALVAEAESASLLDAVKSVLLRVRETADMFDVRYGSQGAQSAEEALQEISREALERIGAQKHDAEERLRTAQDDEHSLYAQYRTAKDTVEEGRSAARLLEREIFTLREERGRLVARVGMLDAHDERLRSEEERLMTERTDAAHLLGVHVLHDDASAPPVTIDRADEVRSAQEDRRRTIERMKMKVEDMGGGGEEIIKEHKETIERDLYLVRELDDLAHSIASLTTLIDELGEKIRSEFAAGVASINVRFQELFAAMFEGGGASLATIALQKRVRGGEELMGGEGEEGEEEDAAEEVSEEGVEIAVTLPHKRLKGMHMLSGGERALTSIALIFAVTLVHPPPFIVLDETDAALDESNARKYGLMVERISGTTQFIIITHTRETMARAQALYGVTAAADGISRLLSIKFDEAARIA